MSSSACSWSPASAATAYEWWYVWPVQKCDRAGAWWDAQDRQCLTPDTDLARSPVACPARGAGVQDPAQGLRPDRSAGGRGDPHDVAGAAGVGEARRHEQQIRQSVQIAQGRAMEVGGAGRPRPVRTPPRAARRAGRRSAPDAERPPPASRPAGRTNSAAPGRRSGRRSRPPGADLALDDAQSARPRRPRAWPGRRPGRRDRSGCAPRIGSSSASSAVSRRTRPITAFSSSTAP